MTEKRITMIVGLSNPDDKYEKTRHNIGFEAIFHISEKYPSGWYLCENSQVKSVMLPHDEILLFVKPMTGMNVSGGPVSKLAERYGVKTEDIIVFHDDIDLAPGKIKVKNSGGSGGHNGLKSIDKSIGTEYARVRIGVGRPIDNTSVINHVLGDFTKEDVIWISDRLQKMSDNFQLLLDKKYENFMRIFNQ